MSKALAPEVAQSLRSRIESGEWNGSRRLPNERNLAAEYKVARNTMRNAINSIAAEGLVSREVGRGTFLRDSSRMELTGLLQELIGVSPIDMMAVRQILEPRAAAMAATNASASDLRDIAAPPVRQVEQKHQPREEPDDCRQQVRRCRKSQRRCQQNQFLHDDPHCSKK